MSMEYWEHWQTAVAKMSSFVLGLDTSCYTTSLAIMDDNGRLIADERELLRVKSGSRGLSQSEMVFQHTRNLPRLFEKACAKFDYPINFRAIGVSTCPRPVPNSYMPAFLVGAGFAGALAATNKVKLSEVSHQEGHIFAGIWSADGPKNDEFLVVHISGGTTELLKVEKNSRRFFIELLGGTKDLNAGQMIDRIGVALGLPFPAGAHLEKMAELNTEVPADIPISVKGLNISFSGPETHAIRLVKSGLIPEAIAEGVQLCVGKSLSKLIKNAVSKTGLTEVLLVGGVSSNQYIRNYILEKMNDIHVALYFPDKKYSSDNAVGVAFQALTN